MAGFRQIHTQIWADEWFAELALDEKMFFIYLFSNPAASLTGLYKLSLRIMEFESGIKRERIQKIFDKFSIDGKAYYENGVVLVRNMQRYHDSASPKVVTRMNKDIEEIPDCRLKRLYLYGIDTVPLNEDEDKDENKHEEKDENARGASVKGYFPNEIDNIQIIAELTGIITLPANQREQANNALYAISAKFNSRQEVIDYLRPFWEEWKRRKYFKANLSWLTDWAVAGEIPAHRKGNNSKSKVDDPKVDPDYYKKSEYADTYDN